MNTSGMTRGPVRVRAWTWVAVASLCANAAAAERLWSERSGEPPAVSIPSLSPLVRDVSEAVLTLQVEGAVEHASISPRDPRLEMFRRFGFDLRMPPTQPLKGQGTGFIISRDGYALSNHHVVENAQTIRVRVGSDRREVLADVVGSDANTDVALLKLRSDRKDWPIIPLGDSDRLDVGDFVVAIGNPFGLSQSVSLGIISARGRRDVAPSGRQGLYDFLQTDASINPGNSGGPLVNLGGEVIGINTAINASGQGIGFAIPVNLVKRLLPDLKEKGRIARSWLGVGIRPINPEMAEGFGLERPRGALVAQVVPGGPADEAGVEPGDIITRFDGQEIDDANELPLLAGLAGVGKKVKVAVVREGRERSLALTLAALPDARGDEGADEEANAGDEPVGKLGLLVEDLDDNLRRRLRIPRKVQGALVARVQPASPAAEAGLQEGDVVLEVNGKKLKSARAFADAVGGVPAGKLVRILLRREDTTLFTALLKP